MGRLAEAAQTSALKGKVTVTDTVGRTCTYEDEATADAAIPAGAAIEHRRGAFFLKEKPKGRRSRRRETSEESE